MLHNASKALPINSSSQNKWFFHKEIVIFFLTIILENLSKSLLLDLDETLIHACNAKEVPQVYIIAHSENGETARVS